MGKISNPDISEALHIELRSAITDLAKSVQVAATRIKLRTKCTAAMKDAAKAENVAAALRVAATSADRTTEQPEAPLAPDAHVIFAKDAGGPDAIETIYAACNWLRDAQTSRTRPAAIVQTESSIATRIVELQDRLRNQGKDPD